MPQIQGIQLEMSLKPLYEERYYLVAFWQPDGIYGVYYSMGRIRVPK